MDSESPPGPQEISTVEHNSTQTGDAAPLGLDLTTAATVGSPDSPNLRLAQLRAALAQEDQTEISADLLVTFFPQLINSEAVVFESDHIPTDDEFNLLLTFHAPDWSTLYVECHNHVAFLILAGSIEPTLQLSEGVTRIAINHTINWHRFVHNDFYWFPADVPELNLHQITFRASIDDPTFTLLFNGLLTNIPTSFFSHLRTAIMALLSPPLPNSSRAYPRSRLVRNIALRSGANTTWLRHLLTWDPRWGYSYWHIVNSDGSGRVRWFANFTTRDMLYHALRHDGSIGWLCVPAPDRDDERFFFAGGTSVVVNMVASTLTAITIELLISAELIYCPPGVHPRYLEVFTIMRTRILTFLLSILAGNNPALERASTRDALRGLEDLLALLPVNEE